MVSRKQCHNVCRLIVLGISCVLVSGCFEDTKQEFTLNPDGSGKMLIESTFVPASEAIRDDEPTAEAAVQEAVREILTRSEGIEAWRDVSFSELKDGSFFFRGTAYFSDLLSVKLTIWESCDSLFKRIRPTTSCSRKSNVQPLTVIGMFPRQALRA